MCIRRMLFLHATLFLLSASAMGCAAGSHGAEYRQAAYTPPPPAPLRPGVGAPVVGQPGHVREDVPRSPHKRVLPPTREPGVWAGDQSPRPVAGEPWQMVLDIELPLPTVFETPEDLMPVSICRTDILKRLDALALMDAAKALGYPERRCLVARLYSFCADRAAAQLTEREVRGEAYIPIVKRRLGNVQDVAQRFKADACPFSSNPRINRIALPIERQWEVVE
jgi:hypothetical protein